MDSILSDFKYDLLTRTETLDQIDNFCTLNHSNNNRVVLISSGGTQVPLEKRTVRFLDNFSAGTRGACSAEHFIKANYSVIFLHRKGSIKPFMRKFKTDSIFDLFVKDGEDVQLKKEVKSNFIDCFNAHVNARTNNRLLMVDYITLAEYLHLLKVICQKLNSSGPNAMLYLAAAVSDFYVPIEQMPEHKIQSSEGDLQLSLVMTPKMLKPLVSQVAPKAFTVSFKLETNSDLLLSKSRQALTTYGHQIVVGNMLETRKEKVIIVERTENEFEQTDIKLTDEQLKNEVEIEMFIVELLVEKHSNFIDRFK